MTREQETKFIGGSMIFLCIVIGVSIFCFGMVVGFHEGGGKVEPMGKSVNTRDPKTFRDSLRQAIKDAGIDSNETIVGKISYGAYRKGELPADSITPFFDSVNYLYPIIHGSAMKDDSIHTDTIKVRKGGYIWRKCPSFTKQ